MRQYILKPDKIVIVLALALLIAAYFVATQPISPRLALVSSFFVIIFALPSYAYILKNLKIKRGLFLLVALGLYALIIESLAIHTGFPYGRFTYTDVLGNKIFGLTPWTVAFAYPPILLLSYFTARTLVKGSTFHKQISTPANRGVLGLNVRGSTFHIVFGLLLAAVIALLCDIVLDPAAVRLGFWYWDKPGFFYGVPLVNFLGWLLTSFIGAAILHYLWGHQPKPTPPLAYSGLAILWFWTCVNLWLGQWIPAILGLVLSIFLVRTMKHKKVQ